MKKMTRIEVLTLTDDKLDKVVKIAGTDWDRKRKVTTALAKKMEAMVTKKNLAEVAEKFGVSEYTVRYNTDPVFRMNEIWRCTEKTRRNGVCGKITCDAKNRVAYKRSLVASGKLTVMA